MCAFRITLPSVACVDGNGPLRANISGNLLTLHGARWRTTKTAAGKSGVNPATTFCNASTPPADAPMTIISAVGFLIIVPVSF